MFKQTGGPLDFETAQQEDSGDAVRKSPAASGLELAHRNWQVAQ